MTWPTSPAAVSGGNIPAAGINKIRADLAAINGFVIKATTESVTSSTALQNDDELFYAIGATGTYKFVLDLWVLCASGNTGDIKFGFTFPTGTLHFHGQGADIGMTTAVSTGQWQGIRSATSGTSSISFGTTSAITTAITLRGTFIATATGTLQLQWAQDVSNANAAQVLSGSDMHVRQVA